MKKKGKKLISIALTVAMIAGLTACGKGNGGNGNGGSSAADASLAKQYVFKEQALDLNMDSDNMNIDLLTKKGDTIYLLFETYEYSENGNQSKLHLATMKQDGTVIDTVELPMWKEGEAPATPAPAQGGEDPVDTPADGADGSEAMPLTEQEASTQDIAAADMDVVDAPAGNSSYTYTSLNNCTVGSDGNVYGIRNYYSETYSENDSSSTNDYALLCWSADGTIKWEADLNDMNTEESYSWVHSIIPNEDGSLTLLLSGDKIEKCTVTQEGITDRKELPEAAATLFNNASSNIITPDGKVQIIYYDESNYTDMYIATYDPATDAVSEGIKLSSTLTNSGYYNMVPGDGDILYYADSNGLFSYNVQTQESKQIMSYINSDLATGSLNNFLVLDEEQFLGFYYDNNEGKMCGGLFTHVKPEDIKDRIVLTLAGNYIDYDLKRKVVEYNKSGDTYRIVVKEYNTYNTAEDYTLGVKQLNNDIISGGMPDILVVDSNMSMDSYIAKGLVANVDDLIAGDEELSKNDYLQNVWDAYRVDGKLYYVIPSFYISTMVGKEAIFGDRTSITMEELQTIRDTMPEGTALFSDETRDSFLYTMMNYCGSDFVDVSTGKCAFDTDNFVAMLTYAAGLPVEYGEDYWGEDYWNNYESQFREDRTLLDGISISNIRDLNGTINGVFGEDISFVGFPTDGDMGSVLWAGNRMYALSAKSKNLDGAWEFLRYYLTQEYQDKIQEQEYNLPVLRSTFEKNVQDATKKPYYMDENGNKVEYDETYYINGEEILLPQLTQEQVDRIVSFVESVNKRGYYNEAISNIISEEAGAYFSGQKSARDVASVIQSRVQVYVNENR